MSALETQVNATRTIKRQLASTRAGLDLQTGRTPGVEQNVIRG